MKAGGIWADDNEDDTQDLSDFSKRHYTFVLIMHKVDIFLKDR